MRRVVAVLLLCLTLTAGGCEDHRTPVEQAAGWWPKDQRAGALCVIERETHGNPNVIGAAGERSVLQIHPIHARAYRRHTGKNLADVNSVLAGQFAYQVLYAERGWQPWRNTAGPCGLL